MLSAPQGEKVSVGIGKAKPIMIWIRSFIIFSIVVVCSGCLGPDETLYPPKPDEPSWSIYIVSHNDWHTGIVVRRQDIPEGIWQENNEFKDFEYIDVGWGDTDYYQALEPTKWMAIKAVLWPTQSVLHVAGFNDSIERYYPEAEIIKIDLSSQGFEQLCIFIQDHYARDVSGQAIRLGPGLLENSRFYLARGKFYLLRSCNVWTAKVLRSAGCPITPLYSISANNIMYQASQFGEIIR